MADLINGRTPEEILTGLKCEAPCHKCAYKDHNFMKDDSCSYYVEQDIIALIERLEAERDAALAQVPKWISVKEQPNPPEDGEYWCHGYWLTSGRKQTESAEYLGEWKIANNFILTHWMPLPEPPEVKA